MSHSTALKSDVENSISSEALHKRFMERCMEGLVVREGSYR